jgi:hypothetical protein
MLDEVILPGIDQDQQGEEERQKSHIQRKYFGLKKKTGPLQMAT